jgi:fatty acid desaturase
VELQTSTYVTPPIKRIPRPEEPIPAMAAPTVALFVAAAVAYTGSTALGAAGSWPWELSTILNGLAAFAFFTVAHETSHAAASSHESVNRWLGRLAVPLFSPTGSYSNFRFIHMQHHRFTNQTDGCDPDHYTQAGPRWLMPLRWATIDLRYARFYLPRAGARPRPEKIEAAVSALLVLALLVWLLAVGDGREVLLFYLLPSRIALFLLAWSFDWLPHHGLHDTEATDRFKTTRNILGLEWLLTPLLLYQNYHLVHHLHPVIPFYRYIAVWKANEDAYLEHEPALADPLGRPLTAAEVHRLRALERHTD